MAILGRNAKIGWQAESQWGTIPGTFNLTAVPFRSESLKPNTNMARMDVRTGFRGRLDTDEILASAYISGDIETLFYNVGADVVSGAPASKDAYYTIGIFPLLADGFGALNYNSTTKTMTLKFPDNLGTGDEAVSKPSYTIVVDRGFKSSIGKRSGFVYAGCKVNEINISGEENNFVRVRFGIVGLREEIIDIETTPPTWGYQTLTPLKFWNTKVVLNDGSNTTIKIRSFELTLNNNYITDIYLNDNLHPTYNFAVLSDMPAGNREISGNFEAFFDDTKFYEKFLSASTISIKITLAPSKITASQTRIVEINIPTARITGETPTISGDGVVFSRLNFVALTSINTKNEMTIDFKTA